MPIPKTVKTKMIRAYESAALKGDTESAYFLSVCYGSGFGEKINKEKMITSAVKAAEGGYLDAVKRIAEQYDINDLPENRTILFNWLLKAAKEGHGDSMVKIAACYLYGIGVQKDEDAYEECITKWVKNEERSDKRSFPMESAMHRAAREGNVVMARYFIKQERSVISARDDFGNTPLHTAAENGHVELVNLLLADSETDVNVKNKDGWTPLHRASQNNHVDVVRILLETSRSDVHLKTNDGLTVLHRPAQNGYIDVVNMLVPSFDADADLKDNNDRTPLHGAAGNGHVDV